MRQHGKRARHSQGATLTEYALIGVLITVVSVPVWQALSGGLGAVMGCVLADFTGGATSCSMGGGGNFISVGNNKNATLNTNTSTTSADTTESTVLPDGTIQIAVDNETYTLPPLVDPEAIVTSASNGSDVTVAYYQNLADLAEKLEETVPETSNLADKIKDVAAEGYNIADSQAIIDSNIFTIKGVHSAKVTKTTSSDPLSTMAYDDMQDSKVKITEKLTELQDAIETSTLDEGAKTALNDSVKYNVDAIKIIADEYELTTTVLKDVKKSDNTDGTLSAGDKDVELEGVKSNVDAGTGSKLTEKHSETICKHQSTHPSCREKKNKGG